MVYFKILFGVFVLSLFTGCTTIKQEKIGEVFQTTSAVEIKKDYKAISKLLIQFKEKLDKRNPNSYDKTMAPLIYTSINDFKNIPNLSYNNSEIMSYKSYLQIAFSKDNIKNRNDYLIIGLYKMIYEIYELGKEYKLTAMSYDSMKLQRAYNNFEVISWKIKNDRDLDGEYLFLTWQNNWQIELEKRLKKNPNPTWEDLQNLEYIKNKKESMLSSSNFSFEVLLNLMKFNVGSSLVRLGFEPTEIGVQAMKTLFIFL